MSSHWDIFCVFSSNSFSQLKQWKPYKTNTLRNSFTLICPHFDNVINYPIDIAWAVFNGNGIFILAFRDRDNVYIHVPCSVCLGVHPSVRPSALSRLSKVFVCFSVISGYMRIIVQMWSGGFFKLIGMLTNCSILSTVSAGVTVAASTLTFSTVSRCTCLSIIQFWRTATTTSNLSKSSSFTETTFTYRCTVAFLAISWKELYSKDMTNLILVNWNICCKGGVVVTLSFNAIMDLANFEYNLKTRDSQKWPRKGGLNGIISAQLGLTNGSILAWVPTRMTIAASS